MKFEKTTQYRSEEGIVFNLSQITLMESDRGRLRELHFGEAKRAHYQVNSIVVDMYDRMQARNLPCLLTVCISNPLTRQQADAISTMRGNVAKGIAAASGGVAGKVGALGGPLIGWASGAVVTTGVNWYLKGALPNLHAGDVLVSIEGEVHGGIGPQRSVVTLVIKV
ncbi:hypothetical protein ACVK1X_001964 [Pseudomonas sp. PvR086]|uniref:hypothetical protein n=1 Tax=Pseudomonas TaxID=286 RepID=UPI00037C464D|nr:MULTISPECIES: hypothetical protein [Pseudomonas]MBD9605699.1 hypothetical protein [Pseudomonas sp. PDM08]MDR7107027.1 hypothetical protein [Pseudomonas frederiksbergensis]UVM38309.1 hypothetical protein LOY28_26980 [Pseudomonas sp. B21-017]CAH0307610.1 hypothetical protein SRABI123_04803 [Pseudomonas sp. Bi123]GID06318.1 hypothetical protein TMM008_35200 [Pseudomonas sp. 008]